ncbi:MAG TPA: tRNA (adenosine(37)-N6)-threonylcarbamoyltransferase complex ATPase subunit type 1 TsaE [Ktedonobacterales bacterium]
MTARDETSEVDMTPVMLTSESVKRTHALGRTLGELAQAGDVVLLEGELGAGKTAFTQGIGLGLGVAATINSPTFTILKEYEGRLPLYHFDLYRLDEPDELYELGFEDYFRGDGVCVVEWAERGEFKDDEEPVWDGDWLRVALSITGEDERTLACIAEGARGHELLAAFVSATGSGD